MSIRWMTLSAVVAFGAVTALVVRADEKPAKPEPSPEVKAIVGQLMSGDGAKVELALATIRAEFANDPKQASDLLARRWAPALFVAQRPDDVAAWALTGTLVWARQAMSVEPMQSLRVRALLKAGRGAEALAAAKSLYNVCTMKGTSAAIELVAQALALARKDEPGLAQKFKLQQLAGANTNSTATVTNAEPSLLVSIKVDPTPYEATIAELQQAEDVNFQSLTALGNLYLLADQPEKAEKVFKQSLEWTAPSQTSAATENVARSMRAQDGSVARANAWILSLREKQKMQ